MKHYDTSNNFEPIIHTLGHSNRNYDEFQKLLVGVEIQTVVDCRSMPRSRFSHFNQNRLEMSLADDSIFYEFRGGSLGGLNVNIDQDVTIDELVERAKAGERIALMCSEAKPESCHRETVLAPLLKIKGVQVIHLLYEGQV